MCGIFAVRYRTRTVKQSTETMLHAASHILKRGGSGVCLDENEDGILSIAYGHGKTQPLLTYGSGSPQRLVCDADIYGIADSVQVSDHIMDLYRTLGFEAAIQCLDGHYAVVLFDGPFVYIARDSYGVKPMYYGYTSDMENIAFASTVSALQTICSSVHEVVPGLHAYSTVHHTLSPWTPSPRSIQANNTRSVAGAATMRHLRKLLLNSVRKRLPPVDSKQTVSCMISGRFDSALIASIVCKLYGAHRVRTYAVGLVGSNDLVAAQHVADFLGTHHTDLAFTPEEGFAYLPSVIRDLESHDVTTVRAGVGTWILAKHIAEHDPSTVLFTGEGADELFCGYLYFHHASSSRDIETESRRLVHEMYKYDLLRADRCVASHGLVLRVPFMDTDVVHFAISLNGNIRRPQHGVEKHFLRVAFNDGYLPVDTLWKRKDGMSDSISSSDTLLWSIQLQTYITQVVPSSMYSTWVEMEAAYYKYIYDSYYPLYNSIHERWLPRWVDHDGEPSNRAVPL